MKKAFSLLLALWMTLSLAACGEKPQGTDEPVSNGGWAVNDSFPEADFPTDALTYFHKAAKDSYTPAAYLGSQVVAGTNYAFLCQGTDNQLYTVVIYRDLNDNADIESAKAVNIGDYNTGDTSLPLDSADMVGGWNTAAACGGLMADAQSAFDAVSADLTGYTPLACLGTQVVAGINYAILCSVQTDDGNGLAVVILYGDLSGGVEVTSVTAFPIA